MAKLICIVLFLLPCALFSQVDEKLQDVIEKYLENTETNADFTQILDELESYQTKELNLNTASLDELLAFPIFDLALATKIINHRKNFGNFIEIAELQVLGLPPELINFISAYVSTSTNYNTGFKDLKNQWNKGDGQVSYTGINRGNLGINNTVGGNWQQQFRFRYSKPNVYSISLNTEKDAGEKWTQNGKPEFVSGHIAIQNIGIIKQLVVGDFLIQNGESLVLGSGIGLGKSAMVMNIKRQAAYIRPYRGMNEFFFQRGIATELGLKNWKFVASFAINKLDASVSLDTFGENENFSSIDLDGLHRTASEIAKKGILQRTIGHLGIQKTNIKGNWGVSITNFNYSLNQGTNKQLYQLFKPTGSQFSYINAYQSHVINNILLFSEGAYLIQNQAYGIAAGALSSLTEKIEIGAHYRNFSKGYYSSLATPFAASSNPELGFYLSSKINFSRKYQLSIYKDFYKNRWFTFNQLGLGFANDMLAQLDIAPNKTSSAYIRWRSYQKLDSDKSTEFITLQTMQIQMLRFHYQSQITKTFKIETRAEFNSSKLLETQKNGNLVYLDFSKSFKLLSQRIAARYTVFNIQDYNARIFAFEDQLLYLYSVAGYYGKGTAAYIMYHIKPTKRLQIALRYSHQLTGTTASKSGFFIQSIFKL